jgi:hypothetical protein
MRPPTSPSVAVVAGRRLAEEVEPEWRFTVQAAMSQAELVFAKNVRADQLCDRFA